MQLKKKVWVGFKDNDFLFAFCLYTFYCLTMVLKAFSAVSVQMPLVILCFFLLLKSTSNKNSRVKPGQLILLSFIIIVFNYIFLFLQESFQGNADGATLVNKIGANFTLFNCMFPLVLVCSGGFEKSQKDTLLKIVLLLTLLTSLTTIYGTYTYADASPCRALATGKDSDMLAVYKLSNIGGYGYIYYLVLLVPMLMKRLLTHFSYLTFVVLLVNAYCIIRAEYTTALLLMFVGVALSIVAWSKSTLVKISMLVLIILFCTSFGQQVLVWAISQFSDTSYSVTSRLEMLADYNESGSMYGDMEDRGMLYMLSLNSFLSNPFFGGFFSSNLKLGNHSEVLDFIGFTGLFGIAIFALYFNFLRTRTRLKSIRWKDPFTRTMLIVAIVLASINTFMAPELYYALVVIPALTTE